MLAHCVSQTLTAHYAHYHSPSGCIEHADIVARDAALDIATTGWEPTAENYPERVPKSRVLEAVLDIKADIAAAKPIARADVLNISIPPRRCSTLDNARERG